MKRSWLALAMATVCLTGVSNAQFGSPQPGTLEFGPVEVSGQSTAPCYDHHWHSVAAYPSFLWSGPPMWEFFGGLGNVGGVGDAIRICYGIDVTQGGRNWTGVGATTPGPYDGGSGAPGGGSTENTWFRWTQGFGGGGAGVDIGIISVQSGTTSARGGDNCFSPFFKGFGHAGDSGGARVGAVAVGGVFVPTVVAPFPIVWQFDFNWGPTPVIVPNKIGDDTLDPGIPSYGTDTDGDTVPNPPAGFGTGPVAPFNTTGVPAPLLANVIYEVQAPINSLGSNTELQYYLGSTIEFQSLVSIPTATDASSHGLGYVGTGGQSNGNANQGFDIFGMNAALTNAVSSSRVIATTPNGSTPNLMPAWVFPANQPGPPFTGFRNGRYEFTGQLAFRTPKLWGYHHFKAGLGNTLGMPVSSSALGPNHTPPVYPPGFAPPLPLLEGRDGDNGYLLFTGNGGTDWAAAVVPLSRIDIVGIDHEAGNEAMQNVYVKVGAYFDPAVPMTFTPGTAFLQGYKFDTTIGGGMTVYGGTAPMGFGTTSPLLGFPLPCKSLSVVVYTWTVQLPALGLLNSPHPQVSGVIGFAGSWTEGDPLHSLGLIVTAREGLQALPQVITGDAIFGSFLSRRTLTFSSLITPSDDFYLDGPLDYSAVGGVSVPRFSSVFEGLWAPETSGQTDMPPGGRQRGLGSQGPYARGAQFHLAGQGVYYDICAKMPVVNEVYNAMTIMVQ